MKHWCAAALTLFSMSLSVSANAQAASSNGQPAIANFGESTAAAGPATTADPASTAHPAPFTASSPDKYTWLEETSGDRAMAWVHQQNEKTAKVLRADPRFAAYQEEALKVLSDPARLPIPSFRDNGVDNFWRDAQHQRGIYRRTTLPDYLAAEPHWRTILDIDALNQAEHAKWTLKGMSMLYPGDRYALVNLSDGGEDAVTAREFDLKAEKFVSNGFLLPTSKQSAAWLDKNNLLIARDWGSEHGVSTMTASGYPYVVKEWKRGTPLNSAKEVFRGKPADVRVYAGVLHDAQGHRLAFIDQGVSFFESRILIETANGYQPLSVPLKSNLEGMLDGRVLVHIREDWTPQGSSQHISAGTLVSFHLPELQKDPAHLKPQIVFAPTATEFLEATATTRTRLLLTTLSNVQGRAYIYTADANGWTRETLPVPENSAIGIATASDTDEHFALTITGFIQPSSLWVGTADAPASFKLARSQPAQFDASTLTVEQRFATSKDGTKVPYFIVHRKNMPYDGTNPTLLNAYGGFEVSLTPSYSATRGKLWLERGGVFVLANIRGGGEFGPAWHEAGLKTKRQAIYDDFAAVGQDLIARKVTSPQHLGIIGGSNGGLLMGVEMEQHPDLWNAVVIQVPLLDMLRFEQIAAGASWVGEYGSVTIPEQRDFLASISPYHNLQPQVTYPEPLIFTTTKDDRVGPQHARKFAALMEEYGKPYFYDEITEGGHGAGADLKQEAGTAAETYVYLARKLMTP